MDKENKVERLSNAMPLLIIMMQEIDDTCVQLMEDVSKKELAIVTFIGDQKQVIMKHIANYAQIPVSTTTGIIDKLVKKRYLKRVFSETNRRSIFIELDKEGKTAYILINKMRQEMSHRIIDDLSEKESEIFISLLEKITGNLNKYLIQKPVNAAN